MTARSKEEFQRERKKLQRKYLEYTKSWRSRPTLPNFNLDVKFVPDPRKNRKELPTLQQNLTKEGILKFEHDMECLNMFMCPQCRECHIEKKDITEQENYQCQSCKKRGDPNYHLDNNLHPIWYLVDDDGNHVVDENGSKVPQYHIPHELACLTMYEKLLIRRCANFVPSVHLKNGIFGIKGHCVTFPQDISTMCDELPQRKETLVTFLRNIGNKDTDNVFPTSLRVNRYKVINALKWLQKHNPFYGNVTIKEDNLDWMNGAEEVNMGSNGIVLNMKESARSKMNEMEEEHVSNVHSSNDTTDDDQNLPMRTVHANESTKVPSGLQAEPIKELETIARQTNQTAKILNFPPIDHDSAIS